MRGALVVRRGARCASHGRALAGWRTGRAAGPVERARGSWPVAPQNAGGPWRKSRPGASELPGAVVDDLLGDGGDLAGTGLAQLLGLLGLGPQPLRELVPLGLDPGAAVLGLVGAVA